MIPTLFSFSVLNFIVLAGHRIILHAEVTLIACPKLPFPRTSPYTRSEGRKMRCVLSVGSKRRDSDRLMSLLWERSVVCRCEHGALSILQLRLQGEIKTNRRLCVARDKRAISDIQFSLIISEEFIIC